MNLEANKGHLRQRGFALIEALIAVVVLATGLLALTALQAALMRSSADAKARSQLAAFAESEVDARRIGGFGGAGLAVGTPAAVTATPADTTPLGLAAKAMGASSLTESITVRQFVASAAGVFPATGCTTTACVTTAVGGRSDVAQYKQVDLTLTWTDATGATNRKLSLSTAISPLALSPSGILVDRPPPEQSGLKPIVRRPIPLTEGMIPLALGNSEDTAATNPKPELVGSTNNTYAADTRFDVLTYNSSDNLGVADYVRFDKRIETAFVGCKCQIGLGGFPTGGSSDEFNVLLRAKAFRPAYWNGTRYTDPVAATSVVRSPDPAASQSELCDVCCRDHRDPTGVSGPLFNPWIASHDHYLTVGGSPVAENGSASFLEACRVVRVDGLWRVTPDPRVDDLALLATKRYPSTQGGTTAPANNNRATQPLVASTASYIAYLYDFLKQKFYSKTTVDRLALQASSGLNVPDYVPIALTDTNGYNDVTVPTATTDPDVRWLHSRGLLNDNLEPEAVTRIDKAIAACPSTATTAQAQAQCILPYLPIATINLTELAEWAGKQTSETGIDVSGLGGAIVNFGQAMTHRFASAIARVGAIGPLDDDDPLKDEQTFALTDGLSKTGTWLKVASPSGTAFGNPTNPVRGFATVAGPTTFTVRLNGIPGTSEATLAIKPSVEVGTPGTNPCTPNSANNSNPYACDSDNSTDVTLGIGTYNRQASTNSNAIPKPCGGSVNKKQDVCLTYSFLSATVDLGATTATYTVVSGAGLSTEKGTFGLLTLQDPPAQSSVVLNFTENSVNARAQCSGTTFVQWVCPP